MIFQFKENISVSTENAHRNRTRLAAKRWWLPPISCTCFGKWPLDVVLFSLKMKNPLNHNLLNHVRALLRDLRPLFHDLFPAISNLILASRFSLKHKWNNVNFYFFLPWKKKKTRGFTDSWLHTLLWIKIKKQHQPRVKQSETFAGILCIVYWKRGKTKNAKNVCRWKKKRPNHQQKKMDYVAISILFF